MHNIAARCNTVLLRCNTVLLRCNWSLLRCNRFLLVQCTDGFPINGHKQKDQPQKESLFSFEQAPPQWPTHAPPAERCFTAAFSRQMYRRSIVSSSHSSPARISALWRTADSPSSAALAGYRPARRARRGGDGDHLRLRRRQLPARVPHVSTCARPLPPAPAPGRHMQCPLSFASLAQECYRPSRSCGAEPLAVDRRLRARMRECPAATRAAGRRVAYALGTR